jgi:HK97 gp10 family phage protein
MAGIFFDVSGVDVLMDKINKMSERIQNDVLDEFNSSALNIQTNAKKYAPVNIGTLRNSIQLKEDLTKGKLVYTIGSKLPYAPYIEFGTGGKVTIPAGYEQFASQFKGGKGGTFAQLLKALMEWVKRKGIVGTYSVKTGRRTGNKSIQQKQNESAAYAIALSILRKGLRPQPFLIPAYEQEILKLKYNIKKILNAKS